MIYSDRPPYNVPADGTGDGTALERFIAASANKVAMLAAGTYFAPPRPLAQPNGSRLVGEGPRATIILGHPELPDCSMLWNADWNMATSGGTEVHGIGFSGALFPRADATGHPIERHESLVSYLWTRDAVISDCSASDAQASGFTIAYVGRGCRVERAYGTRLGWPTEGLEAGSVIRLLGRENEGCEGVVLDDIACDDVYCNLLTLAGVVNGGWIRDTVVRNVRSARTRACGVYQNPAVSGTRYDGGVIEDVRDMLGCGSGVEFDGVDNALRGFTFRRIADCGVYTLNSLDSTISGCTFEHFGLDEGPQYPAPAAIQAANLPPHLWTGAWSGARLTIGRNRIVRAGANGVPMRFWVVDGEPAWDDVTIEAQTLDGEWPVVVEAVPGSKGRRWESAYPVNGGSVKSLRARSSPSATARATMSATRSDALNKATARHDWLRADRR